MGMKFINITSHSNPLIKEVLKIKQKRSKYKNEAFLIEGLHLIESSLESNADLKKILFTDEFISKKDGLVTLRRIYFRIKDKVKVNLIQIPNHIFSRLSDTESPQGIMAVASCKLFKFEEIVFHDIPFIVVCDGIQDAGNLGTIIRASDAAGADAVVILPGTCDPFNPKSIRATSGSIFNISIVYSDTDSFLEYIKLNKIHLFATDVHHGIPVYELDFKKPISIVFGNESSGVSERLKKDAFGLANIPIIGKAESLNVAMAASICLYEVVRQRRYGG